VHIGSNLNAPAQVLAARLQVLYNDQNNAKQTLMGNAAPYRQQQNQRFMTAAGTRRQNLSMTDVMVKHSALTHRRMNFPLVFTCPWVVECNALSAIR
jgi:hypothetical protein